MPEEPRAPGSAFHHIRHFFVLMLENRSFDHVFGWEPTFQKTRPAIAKGTDHCPVDPTDPNSKRVDVTDTTPDIEHLDPPHEFEDVHLQVVGESARQYSGAPHTMQGFAASGQYGPLNGETAIMKALRSRARANGQYALQCCSAGSTPFLRKLAQRYVVCEQWHSSMPGPTWPNRFFAHAGTSGGLDNSPSGLRSLGAVTIDRLGFDFQHGTIFDELDKLGPGAWRIYHGDAFPNVLGIKKMARQWFGSSQSSQFRGIKHLHADLQGAFTPKYIFIEPRYNVFRHHRDGTSQHPAGALLTGDGLVKRVYQAIRHSPLWEKSALIITYDEHGGFFDRAPLPTATAPGDDNRNHDKAEFPANFDFRLLGVRVPTVIVSPWVERQVDPTLYDHTSILATLRQQFGFAALTERDAAANHFAHLFDREQARIDDDEEPPQPAPEHDSPTAQPAAELAEASDDDNEPVSGDQAGVLRIAAMLDHLSRARQTSILRQLVDPIIAPRIPFLAITPAPLIETRRQAREYVARVEARIRPMLLAREEVQTPV